MEIIEIIVGEYKKKKEVLQLERKLPKIKEWHKYKQSEKIPKKHSALKKSTNSYLKKVTDCKDGHYVIVPTDINFDWLFRNHTKQEKEDAKFIVAYILQQQLYKYNSSLKKYGNERVYYNTYDYPISLCADILGKLYPKRYKRVLEVLRYDVLWRFNYDDDKCFNYSLLSKYWHSAPKLIRINTDLTTAKKTIKRIKRRQKNESNALVRKKYNYIYKFHKPNRFKVDMIGLQEYLSSDKCTLNNQNKYWILAQAVKYSNGLTEYISQDSKTDGRLHSIIPQTTRLLRPFVLYFDKKDRTWKNLTEIDLKSSIPYFLFLLIDKLLNNELELIDNLLENRLTNNGLYTYMIDFLKESIDIAELEAYRNAVINGGIYEMFIDFVIPEMSLHKKVIFCKQYLDFNYYDLYMDLAEANRSIMKKLLLSMFFCKTGYHRYKKMEDAFQCHFPTIFNFITSLKAKIGNDEFANLIFQLEASVMYEFSKDYNRSQRGRTPIFLLHDCIVTLEGYEVDLENFLKGCFKAKFGHSPMTSKKYWKDYN